MLVVDWILDVDLVWVNSHYLVMTMMNYYFVVLSVDVEHSPQHVDEIQRNYLMMTCFCFNLLSK